MQVRRRGQDFVLPNIKYVLNTTAGQKQCGFMSTTSKLTLQVDATYQLMSQVLILPSNADVIMVSF